MYCQYCRQSILFDDPQNQNELKCRTPEGTRRYRQQYVNNHEHQSFHRPTSVLEEEPFSSNDSVLSCGLMSPTITSLLSPSIYNLPTEDVSHTFSSPQIQLQHHGSILVQAYSKQVQSK